MWATYKEKLKQMSERLVEAQKPIRLIEAVRWDQKADAKGDSRIRGELILCRRQLWVRLDRRDVDAGRVQFPGN